MKSETTMVFHSNHKVGYSGNSAYHGLYEIVGQRAIPRCYDLTVPIIDRSLGQPRQTDMPPIQKGYNRGILAVEKMLKTFL